MCIKQNGGKNPQIAQMKNLKKLIMKKSYGIRS